MYGMYLFGTMEYELGIRRKFWVTLILRVSALTKVLCDVRGDV